MNIETSKKVNELYPISIVGTHSTVIVFIRNSSSFICLPDYVKNELKRLPLVQTVGSEYEIKDNTMIFDVNNGYYKLIIKVIDDQTYIAELEKCKE